MGRVLASLFAAASMLACDDSIPVKEANVTPPRPVDRGAGPRDGGAGSVIDDAGSSDCFLNPKTHFEIINACTSAVKITKNPVLPKLLADGGLPPLD